MISLILVSILIILKVQLNGHVELVYQHISGYNIKINCNKYYLFILQKLNIVMMSFNTD